jgi:hypothetical protein
MGGVGYAAQKCYIKRAIPPMLRPSDNAILKKVVDLGYLWALCRGNPCLRQEGKHWLIA